MTDPPSMGSRGIRNAVTTFVAPICLLTAFATLASVSLTLDSVTVDEPSHLVAGVSYLQTGDFRLNPEHPPLAKMWAALPLVMGGVEPISTTAIRWRAARQRELGYEFVNGRFEDRERRDPARRLVPARLAMVGLGLMLAGVIYLWSREAWGPSGALVALCLASFSPTLLAHARLVTTDVPAALGFTATLWCFWRFCRAPSFFRAAVLGIALGAALLLKFSTLLLPPMLVALLAVWVLRPPDGTRVGWTASQRLRTGTAALALTAVVAFGVVWAGYGFRHAASRTPEYRLDWSTVRVSSASMQNALTLVRQYELLPEAYAYGVSYVLSKADRRTFLNGRILEHGSRWYFPEALALKSTPAVLVLTGWLLWTATRSRWSFDGLFLAVPIVVYGLTAVLSPLNIGHRHLLPLYALLFVSIGALGAHVQMPRTTTLALAVLLGTHVVSSIATFPRYLSYFNVFGGGAANGWRYLVDSNLDWGQDLRRLSLWMQSNRVSGVYLAYFGSGDPSTYGIRYRTIVQVEAFQQRAPAYPGPGEYFAVSVTLLQGLYVTSPDVARWLEHVRNEMTPIARAGDSIFIYQMPGVRPP
jgi:4-amino-4-deoxy-L-arabinose transferase-like glycosyltransferase